MCDKCNKRVATVVLTQIVDNKQIKLYLCEQCASETDGFSSEDFYSFDQFLSKLLNSKAPAVKTEQVVCPKCGMDLEDFKQSSKVGCAQCYTTFEEYFGELVRRIHGTAEHTGKKPENLDKEGQRQQKIERLQTELQLAIQNEAYELAAKLRDEIKALKNQGGDRK